MNIDIPQFEQEEELDSFHVFCFRLFDKLYTTKLCVMVWGSEPQSRDSEPQWASETLSLNPETLQRPWCWASIWYMIMNPVKS